MKKLSRLRRSRNRLYHGPSKWGRSMICWRVEKQCKQGHKRLFDKATYWNPKADWT